MPQKKKKEERRGMGQANVSAAVTAERLRIRKRQAEGDTRPLSAAERVVQNPQAPKESQLAATKALRKSREIRKIKKSPGFTLEVPRNPEPYEGPKPSPSNPADKYDSTTGPSKPTIR